MDIFRYKEIIEKLPSVIILMDNPVKDILNKVLKESKYIESVQNKAIQLIKTIRKKEPII